MEIIDRLKQHTLYPTNPLGIISIFVFLNETLATVTLKFMLGANSKLAIPMTAFVIIFPLIVCIAFFGLLLKRPQCLYGPQDFRSDDAFVDAIAHGLRSDPKIIQQIFEKVTSQANKSSCNESITFVSVLATALTALNSTERVDVSFAIDQLERLKPFYPDNRTIAIYTGRLYRRMKNYDSAITTLREFIRARQKSDVGLVNRDVADAYYNIACYHSLKAEDLARHPDPDVADIQRLKTEALEALSIAMDLSPENIDAARADADFDFIRTETTDLVKNKKEAMQKLSVAKGKAL